MTVNRAFGIDYYAKDSNWIADQGRDRVNGPLTCTGINRFISTRLTTLDDYAKNGGPGKECSFYQSLCALELKQLLISLLFQIIRLLY